MSGRVFVFKQIMSDKTDRPYLHAIREDKIVSVKSQWGSQNVYLEVNGIEVKGSFEDLVKLLGERIDFE